MKILFSENRYQTVFWAEIARRLQSDGHQIHWLVQNASFAPRSGSVHLMPYPGAKDLANPEDLTPFQQALACDRNANFFQGDASHYPYYDRLINRIVDEIRPDIAIGETALFHELLCVAHCRDRGIPYFQPTTTRYPARRFAFYEYDTMETVFGSGEVWPTERIDSTLDAIVGRKALPEYMNKNSGESRWTRLRKKISDRWILTTEYARGERFNTPHPFKKAALNLTRKKNLARWESIARPLRDCDGFKILFPLQGSPEANLDVWGREQRDQPRIIRELVRATDEHTTILVKANPYPKYEVTDELLAALASSPRVVPLPISTPMHAAFQAADLIITVTGTVAIEAAFAGKPLVTLTKTLFNLNPGCRYLATPASIAAVVEEVRAGQFRTNRREDSRNFLRTIIAGSYRGTIGAPFSNPSCIDAENLDAVTTAFVDMLAKSAEAAQAPVMIRSRCGANGK